MELLSRDLGTLLRNARCCAQWLTEAETTSLPECYEHLRGFAKEVLSQIDKVLDQELRDDE